MIAIMEQPIDYRRLPETWLEPAQQTTYEGLILNSPVTLRLVPGNNPGHRAYQAVVRDGEGKADQVWTVVITDLDSLADRPGAQDLCALHEQVNRTRNGLVSQLFQSVKGSMGDRPMVALAGSALAEGSGRPVLHLSAAFSTETKEYEVIWLGSGGKGLEGAIKVINELTIEHSGVRDQAAIELRLAGRYTVLGTPFAAYLPGPSIPKAVQVQAGLTNRYLAEVHGEDWFATLEFAELKEPIENKPDAVLSAFGATEWQELKFAMKEGVLVSSDSSIGAERHTRVEAIGTGVYAALLIVSAPKGSDLPARSLLRLEHGTWPPD